MKNKVLSILFTIILLFNMTLVILGDEVNVPCITFSYPDKLPEIGETFTVLGRIENNPGLGTVRFTLNFNEQVVQCRKTYLGPVLSKMMAVTNPYEGNGITISCASTLSDNEDGLLCEYEFIVVGEGEPEFALSNMAFFATDGEEPSIDIFLRSRATESEASKEIDSPVVANRILTPFYLINDAGRTFGGYAEIYKNNDPEAPTGLVETYNLLKKVDNIDSIYPDFYKDAGIEKTDALISIVADVFYIHLNEDVILEEEGTINFVIPYALKTNGLVTIMHYSQESWHIVHHSFDKEAGELTISASEDGIFALVVVLNNKADNPINTTSEDQPDKGLVAKSDPLLVLLIVGIGMIILGVIITIVYYRKNSRDIDEDDEE